jgi:hypothetical protein
MAAAGVALLVVSVAAGAADRAKGWIEPAFDFVAHQFYEQPVLAALRRPSQLALTRWHLAILAAHASVGLVAGPWMGRHGRRCWTAFGVGYAIRAVIWIAGGNLPLVPGDSCHYLEVAASIAKREGAVKHYVESYFIDYRSIDGGAILKGRGVLDDWATPLYSSILAGVFRGVGVRIGDDIEQTVGVAKGVSFALDLLALPMIYVFARRRFGPGVAFGSLALLAVLPVHALYAGFVLRESLVALTTLLAVWTLAESWHAGPRGRWAWAVAAGLCGGLAILARNTAMAVVAASGLFSLVYGLRTRGARSIGPLIIWGLAVLAVIAPWARETYRVYGEPFYTYTKYFAYNFSWTVHHLGPFGYTKAEQFYTRANAPEIVRIKVKAIFIIVTYSAMIVGLPVVFGFARRLFRPEAGARGREVDGLVATIAAAFVLGTLANVADVAQVAQLGRYYMPLFVVALPTAVAGLKDWAEAWVAPRGRPWLAAGMVALLWADPTWAYDATWLIKPYQTHWPALRDAGAWVREHPEQVPEGARIMTWFPWEFRLASRRTTILMPRSLAGGGVREGARVWGIRDAIDQYRVTHVLWGSFEFPPESDPERLGPMLESLRLSLGLTEGNELYRSPPGTRHPVRLYRVRGGSP